ncbi:MAG TPA: hypothetical protein VIX73_08170 [Kofleriaceae bacterium]
MVNTVPVFHAAGATAAVLLNGSQVALVLPDVFAQPASGAMTANSALQEILMTVNLVLDVTIDLRREAPGNPRRETTQSSPPQ